MPVPAPSDRKDFVSSRTKKYGYSKLKSKPGREKKATVKPRRKNPSVKADPEDLLKELKADQICFKNPQQLIQKFSDLEERNLFLIEKNQENEQAYFELKKKFEETKQEKTRQVRELEQKKEYLLAKIQGGGRD